MTIRSENLSRLISWSLVPTSGSLTRRGPLLAFVVDAVSHSCSVCRGYLTSKKEAARRHWSLLSSWTAAQGPGATWTRFPKAPKTILNTHISLSVSFAKWPSAWPKALLGPGLTGKKVATETENTWLHSKASKSLPTGSFRVKA